MTRRTRIEYVCPKCAAVASFFGERQSGPVYCYRCRDWPEMDAREVTTTEPSPLLVSDELPSHLRGLAHMMRTNGEVHPE